MKKGQIILETFIGLSIIFILFGISAAFIYQRNDVVRDHSTMNQELSSCKSLADSIVASLASGHKTEYSLRIYHNLTVYADSRLINTQHTLCTLPSSAIRSTSFSSSFLITEGWVSVKNINDTIYIKNI